MYNLPEPRRELTYRLSESIPFLYEKVLKEKPLLIKLYIGVKVSEVSIERCFRAKEIFTTCWM